jgi:peptidoglycan biosynthesis protein MviN/MurJ (putative lipid II flippase)
MLKATIGTWVNYGTTAVFQVFFAARFGSTATASAYALTFTITIALGAIFVGTTQSIYIPRLLLRGGEVLSTGVRGILWLTLLALGLFLAFAACASPIVSVIAGNLNGPGVHLAALMRFAAVFGFSQVVVGQLAALSWARGSRFVPAVTPALPSIVAAVPLVLDRHVAAQTLYVLLTIGSLLQIVLLAATTCRRLRFSSDAIEGLGRLTVAFLGAYVVAQFIVPFEILVAAHASASGGADFNYAYRALAVTQLLIVGGLTLAALPEWSNHVRVRARIAFESSIAQTAAVAMLALSLAAAVGLVASKALVRLAFQHGTFTAHDTQLVSTILVAALVGFVAEGLILVVSPALIAGRRNRVAITFGIARSASVLLLVGIFGLAAGPVGVAVGYSASNVIVLTAQLAYLYRQDMLTRRQAALVRSTVLVTASTGTAAAASLLLSVPTLARVGVVVAVYVGLVVARRETLPRIPKGLLPLSRRAQAPLPLQADRVGVAPGK